MENNNKSFRPDGTAEQQPTTPVNESSEQKAPQANSNHEGKDETQSHQNYNGNSEQNAPARASE